MRIPSVSFAGFPGAEVARSADAVAELLRRRGFEHVEVLEVEGAHPYVFGERIEDPAAPTLLLYAHHDVQPAGELEAVEAPPPFEPTEHDGRLWGRGAADDKAGIIVHAAAVDSWVRGARRMPLNVKIVIEGEEEIGSDHLADFLARYRSKLDADAMVLTDTGNVDAGVPSVTVALRGLVTVDVEVRALEQSVHSGMWGGPVPDPVHRARARCWPRWCDADGTHRHPGHLRPGAAAHPRAAARPSRRCRSRRRSSAQQARLRPGVELLGGRHPLEMNWWQPALAVNAIQASSRKDARNIINDVAWARVGVRLVPDMDPADVRERLVAALQRGRALGRRGARSSRRRPARPGSRTSSHPAFEAAFRALEKGFGRPALAIGCGGSIGFVEPFAKALGRRAGAAHRRRGSPLQRPLREREPEPRRPPQGDPERHPPLRGARGRPPPVGSAPPAGRAPRRAPRRLAPRRLAPDPRGAMMAGPPPPASRGERAGRRSRRLMPPRTTTPALGAEARALERARDLPNARTATDVDTLKRAFADHLQYSQGKDEHSADALDRYFAVAYAVRDRMMRRWIQTQQGYYKADAKRVYYLSLEFLMGRALENNLLNLGLRDPMRAALSDLGLELADLLEQEPDAGLGNGGLGRLAACFLDSMATLAIPAYGYGIRYEFGIFDQEIRNGYQVERPEEWLRFGSAWEIPRPDALRPGGALRPDRALHRRARAAPRPLGGRAARPRDALRHPDRRATERRP